MSARVALVTGSTDGIGKATARSLLADGWEVIVTGRSRARGEATVAELAAAIPGARVSLEVADLSVMADVARLGRAVASTRSQLDLLLLNANAVTQEHRLTSEGFESNMAIGFYGRALLALTLAPLLEATARAQVLAVVGLNLERLDFEAPDGPQNFSSMRALGRWQWAIQSFGREWSRRMKTPFNTYMPGLVKTKILADEPQPMRAFVKVANWLMGIPVAQSGDELAWVVKDLATNPRRDGYYSRKTFKGTRALKEQPNDSAAVWALAERKLAPFR
ncbi:MAG: SDR family NAD(P)-dependent oxidoreductase [Polyangiaceae bacterium]